MPHPKGRKPAFNGIETLLAGVVEKLSDVAIYFSQVLEQRRCEFEWFQKHPEFATKHDLEQMEKRIMATQAELVAKLNATLEQQKKSAVEIQAVQASVDDLKKKIADLQAIIDAGGTVTPELVDAVNAVANQAQVVDDLIPDAPPAPPV